MPRVRPAPQLRQNRRVMPQSAEQENLSKRGSLILAAAELIYTRGCAESSLADIAAEAGVPVGNVYHYFKTKDALAEAVVELRLAQLREWLDEADRYDRPQDRIKRFLRFVAEGSEEIARHGCPFGTLSVELERHNPRLGQIAKSLIQTQLDWMNAQFRRMGKGRKAEDLALTMLSRTQGAAILAHALRDPSIVKQATRTLGEWIEQEASRKS